MIRRLAGSIVEDHGEWLVVRTPAIPTFWWGNFLLFAHALRPGDAIDWERRFVAQFPGAKHRAYGIDGTGGEVGDTAEVATLGVVPDVSVVLTASALRPPPSSASSTATRRLCCDRDWAEALRLRQACDDQPDSDGQRLFRQHKLEEARSLTEQGHGAWFGTFEADQMVCGLGIFSDGSGVARYQSVETHPAHRRRGLARRLVHEASVYATTELAATTLVIVADPGYHAIDLYRSLGFRDQEKQLQLARPPGAALVDS